MYSKDGGHEHTQSRLPAVHLPVDPHANKWQGRSADGSRTPSSAPRREHADVLVRTTTALDCCHIDDRQPIGWDARARHTGTRQAMTPLTSCAYCHKPPFTKCARCRSTPSPHGCFPRQSARARARFPERRKPPPPPPPEQTLTGGRAHCLPSRPLPSPLRSHRICSCATSDNRCTPHDLGTDRNDVRLVSNLKSAAAAVSVRSLASAHSVVTVPWAFT